MHRFIALACAAGVALLMSTGAYAQVPPDPNNPNDGPTPEKLVYLPYGETIKIDAAKKAAAAAIAEATKRGWPMCVAVVGPNGELVYFEKMDDCAYASITIAQHKARFAARFRRPSLVFERLMAKGDYFSYLATLDDAIASRGGNPIVVDGKIVGAIGASGGSGSQDDLVSQAGVAALK